MYLQGFPSSLLHEKQPKIVFSLFSKNIKAKNLNKKYEKWFHNFAFLGFYNFTSISRTLGSYRV